MFDKKTSRKQLCLVITILFAITVLFGCDRTNFTSAIESVQTESTRSSTQPSSQQTQVDRYNEIVDTSKDSGKLSIYFLKLSVAKESKDKSGDCTVLVSPEGEVMLIDTGHPDCASQVVNFLKDLGINRIDDLIISHPHIDHIGGVPVLVENFEVGRLYRTDLEYPTQTYNTYVEAIEKKNIPITYLKQGDEFIFGPQIHIKVFNPKEKIVYPDAYPDNSTAFINNSSLAIKLNYGLSSAFFAGDLYLPQERDLVEQYGTQLQSDIVKANHHGEDTSNSKSWIKTVTPKIMVAMHDKVASMTVYNTYKDLGTKCYYTALNGYVKVVADDKKNYTVIKQFDSWAN